jgi:hypothetical protein
MRTIYKDKDKIQFLGGTYDNWHVGSYASHTKHPFLPDGEITIHIHQGFDRIVFVSVYGPRWENHFIFEDMIYVTEWEKGFIDVVIAKHNSIIRNKSIDEVLG